MAIVTAYRKDTGEAVQVSESILNSPRLGRPFTRVAPPEEPTGASDLAAAGALGVEDADEVAARALTQFNLKPAPPTPKSKAVQVSEPAPASGDTTNPEMEH